MKLFYIIKKELNDNIKYIFFSLFISIYIFLPQIIYFTRYKRLVEVLVMLFLLFLLSKLSKYIFAVVASYLIITITIITHIGIHWGSKGIISRIEVALLSPPQETIEYLKSYIGLADFFLLVYVCIGFYFIYKLLKNYSNKLKIVRIIAFIFFVSSTLTVATFYKNPFTKILPLNLVYSYEEALKWKTLVKEREKYIKTINTKNKLQTLTKNIFQYNKVIIVIGESANKNHMGVYGYNIDTTPFLSHVIKKENWFKFNVIAPANQTRYAVPLALTNATVKDFHRFVHSESLVSVFKTYKYKTYWISNQAKVGKHETYISSIANESDIEIIKNPDWLTAKIQTDKNILDILKTIKSNKNKEMYMIHLLGSHHHYKDRYPDEEHVLMQNSKNIINEYDNSIYYTDYIIQKIFNKFKDEKLLLIYFSDHSELISLNKHGHGFLPPYKDEFEIPLIIYSSLQNKNLQDISLVNKNKIINTESFNHLVMYIMGIEQNNTNISFQKDIFSLDPKNIFDFDKLQRYQNN